MSVDDEKLNELEKSVAHLTSDVLEISSLLHKLEARFIALEEMLEDRGQHLGH